MNVKILVLPVCYVVEGVAVYAAFITPKGIISNHILYSKLKIGSNMCYLSLKKNMPHWNRFDIKNVSDKKGLTFLCTMKKKKSTPLHNLVQSFHSVTIGRGPGG